MIEIESLTKLRAGRPVLESVSFRGAEAGVTVLVGPSGGGKSTLLRCMNGLETFAEGRVTIAGHRLVAGAHAPRDLERVRRDVGMVFQSFNLFPHLSAIDNVTLAPRIVRGLAPAEARRRGLDLLERVGLARFAEARPATLSGGQQQRVAIARSLAMEPRVMLFDEPTSALDIVGARDLFELLARLREEGRTILLSTHRLHEIERRCDRFVIIDAGRIVAAGSRAELVADRSGGLEEAFFATIGGGAA